MTTWWDYVAEGLALHNMTQMALADAIGVNKSTISDWKNKDATAKPLHAISTARAFGSSVMEALVIAGHVPAAEVDMPALAGDPRLMTNDQLTTELRKRFQDLSGGSTLN